MDVSQNETHDRLSDLDFISNSTVHHYISNTYY
jgi:hypothetical protein